MDDMFGTSYINSKKLEDWLSEIGNMERVVKARKGNLKVICTSRKYIFNDVQSVLAKFPCFGKINIVDMTDDANELSDDEKLAIFSKFADEYTVELDAASLKKIPRLCPPHGFPHCVELFCTNAFFRQNGLSFFDNPSECVQKEIHNFKDNDRLKFLVLVLMVLKKSKIPSGYFGTLIENIQDDEIRLFKTIGVSLDTGNLGILKAVEALTNTYLKRDGDGSFVFTHESLKENVAVVYISVNPAHAAELLSFQQIVSYTKLGVSDTNSEKQNVSVARLPTYILVEKITKEVLNGNIKSVCNCRAWYDATFIDAWLSYIICENQKVPNCLLTKMLEGTFSTTENNAWEHTQETTVLATFIKNNMQAPVIAILSSKDLQHILKDSRVWNRLLQDGLELACSRSGKFNLDIIKTILICREGDKMLDGSKFVINALCASNVYCVKLLLDKTEINLDYNDGFGGYFHYLVMSDIPLEDYFMLFDALLEKGVHVSLRKSSAYSPLDRYGYGYNTKKAYAPVFQCILNASTDENAIRKLERLVYSGADLNGFYCGRNLVSFAIESLEPNTCLKVLTKLYELDANFHIVNNDHMNALHILCRQSSDGDVMNVQKYLFAIGVDASHCDRHGAVPLMYALRNGLHAECIQGLFDLSPSKHTDKLGQG